MLYTFCPAAARWWLVGADPTPPFDPIWKSLEDLTTGATLHDFLIKYGFDNLVEDIRAYIREVEAYRRQHNNIRSPELMPLFRGGNLSVSRRYSSQHAINNLGGDWRNLYLYVRTWAFLSQDWRSSMRLDRDSEYALNAETVCLTLPGVRLPVQFDTWIWKASVGHVTEAKIGALVAGGEQDQLRFALLKRCTTLGKQPWPSAPAIFALDRENGEAKRFDQTLADRDLENIVGSLSDLAKKGPHPPLAALRQPSICKRCGYQQLCFERNFISPHALKGL